MAWNEGQARTVAPPPSRVCPRGIAFGESHPLPIVAHAEARRRGLTAFASIRG